MPGGWRALHTDNHIRQTLDPVEPHHLFSLFDDVHRPFDQAGLLEGMRAAHRTRLIALDATWYFSSQSKNIHCPNSISSRNLGLFALCFPQTESA
jgi:hypothetical protein